MSFVHLHVHSEYSLLDGFSNIKKLVARAKALGMPALGLTDHGTMFGVIDFYNAAMSAGIKPIIGIEAYLASRTMKERNPQEDKKSTHILLLAENQTGYHNLLQLASAAQLEGFYYYPRVDHERLAQFSEGLICSSGCMSAEVPRLIQQGNMDGARKTLDWYYETFGKDNFFLELQSHDIPELEQINKSLLDLGRRYDARFIATNDVHYINREDARLQDILLAIQTGCVLSDPNRMRMTDNSYYLRTAEEMTSLFAGVPDALNNTLLIAERCNVDLGFKGYHLPNFDVPEGCTPESYLRELCETGLQRRFGARAGDAVYRQRLEYELGIIHTMGFDTYFLIVWDLCRYAREQGIWYNARGSAAGSIVAYCLDITVVDPIEHGLIFERFLNPGRISMPDIDLDFRDDRRADMLEYTAHKYGDDKVAQIITFGTLGARAAIRDVGRVMDIPLSEVDKAAKLIPNIPGKPVSIQDALEEVPEFKKLYDSEEFLHDLIDTASQMEGVVRNAGTHAAGVVITDKPVAEYLPLHRPTGQSAEESPIKAVTQFEMGILDSLGLLKVDFLGLATLTIMARACDLIRQRHGITFDLTNIPVDDPATYELMGRGDTAGVFQVEGNGMRRWLVQMKPKELANVIAMVALFRPGPMDFIPGYIRRMHGEEKVDYRHPLLEPIFKETYGYPVYQEQLMFAAINLAGYTPSESDELRKAISKKQKDKLLKHREKFIKGAREKDIAEDTAAAIFDDWEEFARYGFNKCLPGDTEVVDYATGRLVRIEDIYTGKAHLGKTVSCDTQALRLQTGQVSNVMENGVKPVFRLTTALGRRIEATANHPFYTYNGWEILDHLQAGDMIATPRCIPLNGQAEWPDHEVIALGHLLAEGNLCHPNSVYFYSQDDDQVADFIHAAEQFDNVHCTSALYKGTWSVYASRADRKIIPGIVLWAQRMGIWGKNARQKEIPAAGFELNNRQIGLLISRMWEGDGHIDVPGRSLFYATASERMARQLQHLLLRLGIVSRLRQVTFPYKDGRTGYQLFITNNKNIVAFAQQIGCYFISDKRKRALDTLTLAGNLEVGTRDIVPLAAKALIRTAKKNRGVTWPEMNAACGVAQREFYPAHTITKRGYTRETVGRLAAYFDDPALRRLADNDIYWDEIVAIEYVGEKQTYDLEVADLHNFVANDILVHNSHAADYGIIAVQTGYLKCHYPVEYMTALMSVTKNETEKVAWYAADCRRMGIDVMPPDVNHSGWDFTIEDCPDDKKGGCKSVIRFGLGAIKNVGQGAVEVVIATREKGGAFKDVNDFARRVDLRQVGKRALESMIRVGAMDSFGSRPSLLAALDTIMSVNAANFRAAEAGQLSLFGAHTGVTDEVHLPKVVTEVSRREILNWERELIGLYVSDHPLSPVMDLLNQTVSHFAGQLADANHGERVRVAGLVTRMRNHQTKTGAQMAFVTIEDIQGNIELVIFPRTWEKVQSMIEFDKIILVDGKVDNAEGTDPKVLVDAITTEFKVTTSVESAKVESSKVEGPKVQSSKAESSNLQPSTSKPSTYSKPSTPKAAPEPRKVAETPKPDYTPSDGPPPPPDNFPEEWTIVSEMAPGGFVTETARTAPLTPPPAPTPVMDEPDEPESPRISLPEKAAPTGAAKPAQAPLETRPPMQKPASEPLPLAVPPPAIPYIVSPVPATSGEDIHMLTLVMRSCGDKVRDNLRIRQAYGTLISYPGNDKFAFQVFERGRGYLVEFPNFTTGLCPELVARLQELVGAENVRVEPITIL